MLPCMRPPMSQLSRRRQRYKSRNQGSNSYNQPSGMLHNVCFGSLCVGAFPVSCLEVPSAATTMWNVTLGGSWTLVFLRLLRRISVFLHPDVNCFLFFSEMSIFFENKNRDSQNLKIRRFTGSFFGFLKAKKVSIWKI